MTQREAAVGRVATTVRRALRVTGVVQGVGFRPYVVRLATSLGLHGVVGNDNGGVFIEVEGSPDAVVEFLTRLPAEAPPLAHVESVTSTHQPVVGVNDFRIVTSRTAQTGAVTVVPPDTAICDACWADVREPTNRRYRYPFTACTHCGPRYTIVTRLPYDRPFTTMAAFPLCPDCQAEYEDPADRRFHAQPTACPVCGPQLWFRSGADPPTARVGASLVGDDALVAALRVIAAGGIVAVKGVGGYHLACDARQPAAVATLRARKGRGDKPMAVMVADIANAQTLVRLSDAQRALLHSPEGPIVLAPVADQAYARALADSVAPANGQLGVLLAYSALHRLLLSRHPDAPNLHLDALVMTSGNLSDEPICTDPAEADQRLAGLADAFLHHDRPIHVACDDSVVRAFGVDLLPIRRSRGYAPLPVRLPVAAPPLLAVGGELKTTVCLAAGERAWLSQHIGDAEHLATHEALVRTVDVVQALTRVTPEVVVADAHPGYLSRQWAQRRAAELGADLRTVQHHHAHLASLLAEHGVPADEPVLGVAFDGTGYGTDATIWGGELLLGSYRSVDRVGHLRSIQLPGGDAAIRRPARAALAHLHAAGLDWSADVPSVADADPTERRVLAQMLSHGSGCTPTTSMGRLFDTMASLLAVRHDVDYEGQAAMELEALAATAVPDAADTSAWAWELAGAGTAADPLILDPTASIAGAVAVVRRAGARPADAAHAFHVAVAEAVVAAALRVRAMHGSRTVGLTGGVFQNVLLSQLCRDRLSSQGFVVLTHRTVPPNDGGLALGQAAVVAGGGG